MTSITNLKHRSQYLKKRIEKLEKIIALSPPGTLYIKKAKHGHTYTKYIKHTDGSSEEFYLSVHHAELTPLADKRLAELELADLYYEKRLIDRTLALRSKPSKKDNFVKAHPEILSLASPSLHSLNQLAAEWASQPYRKNNKYPEDLKFPTVISDLKVRSKAEADLVSRFVHYGVPLRYEEVNVINGEEFAIDFTLLNVRSGRKLYWNHRGMSDDPQYLQKVHYCEKRYLETGIIPWVNMIVTVETKDTPLDIQWVDELIEYFLL